VHSVVVALVSLVWVARTDHSPSEPNRVVQPVSSHHLDLVSNRVEPTVRTDHQVVVPIQLDAQV